MADLDKTEVEIDEKLLAPEEEPKATKETEKQTPDFEIPEKFKGKSAEEIAKAYTELEKKFGKQGQDLGELRKQADMFIRANLSEENYTESDEDVKFDYDDPDKYIDSKVKKATRPLENKIREEELRDGYISFATKHPDFLETVQTPEFKDWVLESPTRQRLYAAANQPGHPDFDAANELLDTFKALHARSEMKEVEREAEVQSRVNEMSTAGRSSGQTSKKIFSRAALIDLRANNPAEYKRLMPEIQKAYEEGRVR